MRYFVTGTDTGVGKTRVTAALARALVARDEAADRTPHVTVVKLVQTGLAPGESGDADEAAALAGCSARELHRFRLPADPWNAALADGQVPLRALALASELDALAGALAIEGTGGAAVPLNDAETFADVAARAGAHAVVTIGLRLGCINHAILTLEYLARRNVPVVALAYTEPWEPVDPAYRLQVERTVSAKTSTTHAPRTIRLPHDSDAARSVATAAGLVDFLPA